MIDVLINQNGDLHLAHDAEDLPRLTAVKVIRSTGALSGTDEAGIEREIGTLSKANLAILGANASCSIFPLNGFEILDAYDASLGHV